MPYEIVEVESYSGYKIHERPVSFSLRGRRHEVSEIVDRWYEGGLRPGRPPINYYKVRSAEGDLFLLRYVALFDAWSVWIDEEPPAVEESAKEIS